MFHLAHSLIIFFLPLPFSSSPPSFPSPLAPSSPSITPLYLLLSQSRVSLPPYPPSPSLIPLPSTFPLTFYLFFRSILSPLPLSLLSCLSPSSFTPFLPSVPLSLLSCLFPLPPSPLSSPPSPFPLSCAIGHLIVFLI